MLTLTDATYHNRGSVLVDSVSLALHPGEVLAVVGANGAGKTTLLRLLSGEIAPTRGVARWSDAPLEDLAPEALATRRAVLPQRPSLPFGFTAEEVVKLGRTPHATGAARDSAVALAAMQAAGVEHIAARAYPTLSGGEQQRVHLARALAQIWDVPDEAASADLGEGRCLLLDEPTSALDLAHQHRTLQTARACSDAGVAVLAVLHDLNLAAQYADRIAVLSRGRILALGAPEHVLTTTIIREAFALEVMITAHPCATCPLVVPLATPRPGVVSSGRALAAA